MKRIIFALVISMVCMSQAFGAMLTQGTRQLSVVGMINDDTDVNVNLGLGYGYFIKDNIEIGGAANLDMVGGGDLMRFGAAVFSEYNFILSSENWVPFMGVSGGIQYWSVDTDVIDDDDFAFEIIGYGGVKYFVVENLSIGTALRLKASTEDVYLGDGEMESADWDIVINTGFYF